jgi:subtilisin family serine protease
MGRIVLVAVLCATLLHCSKNSVNYTQKPAPRTEENLGFIVSATESEIQKISLDLPSANIRAISPTHGVFEISGTTAEDLTSRLSNKQIDKNAFIQAKNFMKSEISLTHLAKNTSDDAVSAIQTCQTTKTAPTAEIDISYSVDTLTVDLGESVKIAAVGKANALVGGDVRLLWDILPPESSKQTFTTGVASEQTFTPDSVGFYRIAVVAQGKDRSCTIQIVPLFVTANPVLIKSVPLPDKLPALSAFVQLTTIQAEEAWIISKGKGAVIAVVDTGLNYNHPGINSNIEFNSQDPDDGNDEDGNGFADDFMGWDFINGDKLPFDDEGHGSHVSGLIASSIMGVAPQAKIIPIKALNAAGSSDLATITGAIFYAVDSGAQIINASIGFSDMAAAPVQLLKALQYAKSKNVLFISAAGNGDASGIGYDIKIHPDYPAAFQDDNLIAVAATARGKITSYSNFSNEFVQLGAPGGDELEPLFSLATQNANNQIFAPMVGTSMATPVTCGVAALILGANPNLSPLEIKTILMTSGTDMISLKDKTVSGKQINAKNAVNMALDLQPVLATN